MMLENENVPKIRFKWFTKPWDRRKLGELCKITTGKLDANAMTSDGKYDFYTSGIDVFKIDVAAFEGPAITIAGNGASVGYMHLADGKFNAYQRTYVLTKFFADRQFLNVAIGNELPDKIQEEVRGSGIPYIVLNMLTDLAISLPLQKEQAALGQYFTKLDSLITLYKRKYEKLKQIRKSMLEKMFPHEGRNVPEIRFKGFTEPWERHKLGELVSIYDGTHQTPEYQNSGIMFLSVENISTLKSNKYISEEVFKRDYKVYPKNGDILMTRMGDVGNTNVVKTSQKLAFYVSLALLKPNGINSYFLNNAMKTSMFQSGLRERTLLTAIPQKINKDDIGKVDIFITSNAEEQKQLGNYFQSLDRLIILHEQKYEKLKQIKKSLLKKMFA